MSRDKLTKRELEELSAFLDGESKVPETIRARLDRDETLANRYRAYARMGRRMQGVKDSNVDPRFTGRVMAELRGVEPAPTIRWGRWGAWSLAAAALIVIIAGPLLIWRASTMPGQPAWELAMDPDRIEEALAMRIEELPEGEPIELTPPLAGDERPEFVEAGISELLLLEISAELDDQNDLDQVLESLNSREKALVKTMLLDYAAEG